MAFEIVFNQKPEGSSHGPTAYIAIDIELRDEEGRKVLTPKCVSADELNIMATMLIRELEQLKREAYTLFNQSEVIVPPSTELRPDIRSQA